ncbi:LysR family transcriptional regulator, partial [Rhizobiaceae bacterium]|nr:LysR family transcriptional regulator [Rhizobiaceae bacterium]
QRLNVSQSALSVQIRMLEERLGHALFERRGRKLHLTEAGQLALERADVVFAAGAELMDAMHGTGQARPTLKVGALATLSRNFQIGVLESVMAPDVDVVLKSGTAAELLSGLEAMTLDVVLLNHSAPSTERLATTSHRLAEQHVGLIGRPEWFAPGDDLRRTLEAHPVIVPTRETGIRIGFDALVERLNVRPRIIAEVDDMAMIRLLARKGTAMAVIPPIVVKDELDAGTLVEAHRLEGITETFYAVTAPRRFPNPLVLGLLEANAAI